jgi:ABC-type sugar transport system ATPase subunit
VSALTDANLIAPHGEVHAVIGENGAGKSTMLRLLAGLLRQDAGAIDFDGAPWHPNGPRAAAQQGVRVVFQELSLLPELTAAANLLFGDEPVSRFGTIRRQAMMDQARRILDRLEVADIEVGARVRDLPSAHRQKLEIAKALWRRPAILILDEPTSMLGHADSEWLLGQARRAAADGAVVLFISHRLGEIRAVTDSFTVLRDGRDVAHGALSDYADDDLIEAMLGRQLEQLYAPVTGTPGDPLMVLDDLAADDLTVSMVLRRGEILGVAGLEGQGQRQLFMSLAGARPFRGKAYLAERPFAPRSPRDALDVGVALVPEDRRTEGLLGPLTVRENITLSTLGAYRTRARTIDRSREEAAARREADVLNLPGSRLETPVSVLSGGNQQKVIVARSLLTRPKVLLLYDCTRGVDVGTKAEIFARMQQLAADGLALLFYSSDLAELERTTHRTIVLSKGRAVATLEGRTLTEGAMLRAMMDLGGSA